MIKRPRRLRSKEPLRRMVRETRIDKASLIYPLFVREGEKIREEIPSMPGQYRYSVDRLPEELEQVAKAGVPSVMLFGIPGEKDEQGSQAYAQDGIIQRALREAKRQFPDLYYITAGKWTTTPPSGCWPRPPSPRCRQAPIWWPPLT